MSEDRELSDEDMKNIALWTQLALVHGYNALVKLETEDLEVKAGLRFLRDSAASHYARLSGTEIREIHDEETILSIELPNVPVRFRFRESDIELMRACVAARDAERAGK